MTEKDKSVLLPMIRKLMPNIIAQDIVGVQPMTASTGSIFNIKPKYLPKFRKVDVPNLSDGWVAVEVDVEVSFWIQSTFPISDWTFTEPSLFVLSEQAYTMMVLRWSS